MFRPALRRSCSLRPVAGSSLAGPPLIALQRRCIQYQHTSEVNLAAQPGKKAKRAAGLKWMTKSTMEYVSETRDSQREALAPVEEKPRSKLEERARTTASVASTTSRVLAKDAESASKASEDMLRNETGRLLDRSKKRTTRLFEFFKRHGKAFFCCYLAAYLGCWFALYSLLTTGAVSKGTMLDMARIMVAFDRESVLQTVEAWDTYINVGFSFVINDMLEILRLPFVLTVWYYFLPYFTRRPHGASTKLNPNQLWSRFAPEEKDFKPSMYKPR